MKLLTLVATGGRSTGSLIRTRCRRSAWRAGRPRTAQLVWVGPAATPRRRCSRRATRIDNHTAVIAATELHQHRRAVGDRHLATGPVLDKGDRAAIVHMHDILDAFAAAGGVLRQIAGARSYHGANDGCPAGLKAPTRPGAAQRTASQRANRAAFTRDADDP